MRVLHIGNAWPVAALRELGHGVVEVFARFPELAVPGRPFDVGEVWARLDDTPDVVLVVDTLGRQTLPYGFEKLPVPCGARRGPAAAARRRARVVRRR